MSGVVSENSLKHLWKQFSLKMHCTYKLPA